MSINIVKKGFSFAIILLLLGLNVLSFIDGNAENTNENNCLSIEAESVNVRNMLSGKQLRTDVNAKNQNSNLPKVDVSSVSSGEKLDDYKYIIITIRDLETSFERLIDHKSQYITSRVVTVEDDILPISDYWVNGSWGDNNPVNPFFEKVIPGEYCELFNDTQAKIRNFIRYAVITMGTRFILLGGDVEIIPARSLWAYIPEWWDDGYEPLEEYVTSDVYYACLDGTWDDDFDSRFGEPEENSTEDEADFWSDVYVGRAPVNTGPEASSFISKVMKYESSKNRPNVITMHQSGINPQNDPPSEVIPNKCLEHITGDYNVEQLYANNSEVTEEIWRDSFIDGRLIVLHVGNGNETLYELDNINHPVVSRVWSIDDIFDPGFQYNFYPIHISIACNSGNYSKDRCLAEGFITREGGGASACIFNTNYGVTSPDDAQKYSGEFIEQIFIEMFVKGTENLGKVHQYAKESFLYQNISIFNDPSYRWCYYTINLLGDPEMLVLSTERLGELPDRIWVDDDFNSSTPGWNISRFSSIQDGLDRVNSSGAVVVLPGIYYENVIIRKSIILEGGGMENTVIDGRFIRDVVRVEADNVEVSGFTIRNSGYSGSGEYNFDSGIHIFSNSNDIHDNYISFNENGIRVEGFSHNDISSNLVTDSRRDGIALLSKSSENSINNNIIQNCNECGIWLSNSKSNLLKKNNIKNCGIGIYIMGLSILNTIKTNKITNSKIFSVYPNKSGCGICLEYTCFFNEIVFNYIGNNENTGILLRHGSNLNRFQFNDIINNTKNANFINCFWNRWRENYWDDWYQILPYYTIIGRLITIPILNYDSTPLKVPNTNWPPYIPTNPDPSDGAINVSIDADLSWNSGDPNFANTVIYDIYFGTTNPPPYLDTTNAYPGSQTRMAYSLESLNSNETYYWQIVAKDNNGESSTGPIWSFISNI